MERRKRSVHNATLAPEPVWKIKQLIIEQQWSSRQISGGEERRKEYFRKYNMQLYIIRESLKVVLMKSIGGFSSSGIELC